MPWFHPVGLVAIAVIAAGLTILIAASAAPSIFGQPWLMAIPIVLAAVIFWARRR